MARVVNKTKGFSSISRDCVFDSEISDRARFLYVYMACKPEGWEFFQDNMAEELGIKKDTLRKYLDELIIRGWVTELEQANEGKFSCLEYIIEIKRKNGNLPIRKKTDTEKNRNGKNINHKDIDNISSKQCLSDKEEIENKKEDIKSSKKKRFVKPTIEEIQAYIDKEKLHFDAEQFYNHYESNGWMVGRTKMVCWKSACHTWERLRKGYNKKEEPTEESTQPDLWQRQQEWFKRNVPNIAHLITKEMYGKMRIICIVQMDFQQALLNMNEGFEGDFLEAFREEVKRCAGG